MGGNLARISTHQYLIGVLSKDSPSSGGADSEDDDAAASATDLRSRTIALVVTPSPAATAITPPARISLEFVLAPDGAEALRSAAKAWARSSD